MCIYIYIFFPRAIATCLPSGPPTPPLKKKKKKCGKKKKEFKNKKMQKRIQVPVERPTHLYYIYTYTFYICINIVHVKQDGYNMLLKRSVRYFLVFIVVHYCTYSKRHLIRKKKDFKSRSIEFSRRFLSRYIPSRKLFDREFQNYILAWVYKNEGNNKIHVGKYNKIIFTN